MLTGANGAAGAFGMSLSDGYTPKSYVMSIFVGTVAHSVYLRMCSITNLACYFWIKSKTEMCILKPSL